MLIRHSVWKLSTGLFQSVSSNRSYQKANMFQVHLKFLRTVEQQLHTLFVTFKSCSISFIAWLIKRTLYMEVTNSLIDRLHVSVSRRQVSYLIGTLPNAQTSNRLIFSTKILLLNSSHAYIVVNIVASFSFQKGYLKPSLSAMPDSGKQEYGVIS